MPNKNLLILTDHRGHSAQNSLYTLARALRNYANVWVATRGEERNAAFFDAQPEAKMWAAPIDEEFAYREDGSFFQTGLQRIDKEQVDFVLLRLPPPLSPPFLTFLENYFSRQVIANRPSGIYETGSKAFLLNFPDCCPPMRLCRTREDIIEFSRRFPIVLKPLREYGGKGIVKIADGEVEQDGKRLSLNVFLDQLATAPFTYLGVQFLKNVSKGDKRIVVADGEILGASLRLPAENSWLCNVAKGGRSEDAVVTEEERNIIQTIHPILIQKGIVLYGVDTLVDDQGKRVLSEINTTSIGGIMQAKAATDNHPVDQAAAAIWHYFVNHKQ